MKVIFFGSSEFSIHALKACLNARLEILQVITTPPQKKGRGLVETPTPVQTFAEKEKLPLIAPPTLKAPEVLEKAQSLKPELFVVSSYGKMIPKNWLSLPSRYALNVHPSLLPKYRGAAPINWPILLGDKQTGMTIIEVTAELDAGDIFYQQTLPLTENTDSVSLTHELGQASHHALLTIFQNLKAGETLKRTAQNHAATNYARKLVKEDGAVAWSRSAEQIHNQVRGLLPWPCALTQVSGEPLQILKTRVSYEIASNLKPGQVVKAEKDLLLIQTGRGVITLERVKPAGKKEMSAGDFARGKRLEPGFAFESAPNPPNFILSSSYK